MAGRRFGAGRGPRPPPDGTTHWLRLPGDAERRGIPPSPYFTNEPLA